MHIFEIQADIIDITTLDWCNWKPGQYFVYNLYIISTAQNYTTFCKWYFSNPDIIFAKCEQHKISKQFEGYHNEK